ncbi:MAG: phage virion morphogenesis protein [Treponemataceae bacterium]
MNIQFQVNQKKNDRFFDKISSLKPLMQELSLMGQSAVQKNIENNTPPPNAPLTKEVKQGSNTLKDNGRLRASITARHTESDATIGTNVAHARVHNPEDGRTETVIKPKKAKFLTIPASPKTRTFQRRYGFSAREVIEGLKNDGWIVYRPYKKGTRQRANVIMAKKPEGKAVCVFILKTSVTVPARPFMFLPDDVIAKMETRVVDYYES